MPPPLSASHQRRPLSPVTAPSPYIPLVSSHSLLYSPLSPLSLPFSLSFLSIRFSHCQTFRPVTLPPSSAPLLEPSLRFLDSFASPSVPLLDTQNAPHPCRPSTPASPRPSGCCPHCHHHTPAASLALPTGLTPATVKTLHGGITLTAGVFSVLKATSEFYLPAFVKALTKKRKLIHQPLWTFVPLSVACLPPTSPSVGVSLLARHAAKHVD